MDVTDIQSTPDGREIRIHVTHAGQKWIVNLDREFLDDEVGDNAGPKERRKYTDDHIAAILKAAQAKIDGGHVRHPFDRVSVERG